MFPFATGVVAVALISAIMTVILVMRHRQIKRIILLGYLRMQTGMPHLTLDQVRQKFPELFDERALDVEAKRRIAGLVWFISTLLWIVTAAMLDTSAPWGITSANGVGLMVMSSLSLAVTAFLVHLMIESIRNYRDLKGHRSSFNTEPHPQLA